MNKVLPPSIFADLTQHSADSPKDFHEPGRQFSLVQFDETVNGQSYRIQVGQDRSEDEHFRKTFGALLWGTLGLGTVAIAAIAISVTRRGLRPLREIARMVGDVGPARLSERLTQRGWPTEIKPLAEAFDEMLARLQDAFTRLSQFSADLAHELRTPVGNLLGEAQVALRRERPSQDYRQVIESSLAECERLSAIIDNLLFLARAEAADRQVQRISFDASSAVAKIIAMYEPVAEEQQVTLHCGGNGQVYADPILFQRAVNNLVENALRHTPSGGSVLVRITTKSGDVRIEVTDTGCGIAPEHQAHVFDRFYRVDPSRNSEGTGLGLALVKSIMDLHNGRAELRSQRGVGTTVTISFPNDRATAAVPPIAPDTLIRPAG